MMALNKIGPTDIFMPNNTHKTSAGTNSPLGNNRMQGIKIALAKQCNTSNWCLPSMRLNHTIGGMANTPIKK